MKYLRCILTFVFVFFILNASVPKISAIDTGFATGEMTQDRIDYFLQKVSITKITEEPAKRAFQCFDVNEKGLIAIGSHNHYKDYVICVYNGEGVFLYGYEFDYLAEFFLEFNGDTVIIYFVRSDIVVAVDSAGEITGVEEILDTTENTYYRNNIRRSGRIMGDTKYTARNDMGLLGMFAVSYSQLVVTEAGGKERIIYDVNSNQFVTVMVVLLFLLALVCLAVFGVVMTVRKAQRSDVREKYDIEKIIESVENNFKRK